MKENNPLYYLPSSQLFPASIADGIDDVNNNLINQLKIAKKYAIEDCLSQALLIYNDLIEEYPNLPFLFACRSLLKSHMDEDEGAFYDYQVAKNIDFNYHHILEWLGNSGQMQESDELLELMKKDNGDEQFYINRATLFVQHFDYNKAIIDFTKAYSIGANPIVLVSRGAVNMRMGRYDLALEDFNSALVENDSLIQAYIFRAKLYVALDEMILADLDFSKAVSLSSDDSSVFEERAQFYESQHKYDLAIADYSNMIALKVDDFYGYVLRADLWEKLENWNEALEDYDKAISLNPYYSDLYQYRGAIRESLGDHKGAKEDFQKFDELEDE